MSCPAGRTWPAGGIHRVALSYHWALTTRPGYCVFDGERTALPADVPPGGEVVLPCRVSAPLTMDQYVLEFDRPALDARALTPAFLVWRYGFLFAIKGHSCPEYASEV